MPRDAFSTASSDVPLWSAANSSAESVATGPPSRLSLIPAEPAASDLLDTPIELPHKIRRRRVGNVCPQLVQKRDALAFKSFRFFGMVRIAADHLDRHLD